MSRQSLQNLFVKIKPIYFFGLQIPGTAKAGTLSHIWLFSYYYGLNLSCMLQKPEPSDSLAGVDEYDLTSQGLHKRYFDFISVILMQAV